MSHKENLFEVRNLLLIPNYLIAKCLFVDNRGEKNHWSGFRTERGIGDKCE
jgi:hypothetical protein